MLQKFKYIIGLSTIILLVACKKEIIQIPESNQPVLRAGGKIGTDSINLVVGENAMMTTQIDTINKVAFYNGILTWEDKRLEIGFYDGHLDGAHKSIFEVIGGQTLGFSQINATPVLQLSKNMFSAVGGLQNINWFVNGTFYSTNDLTLLQPGKYDICGEFIFGGSESYTICNEMIVGYDKYFPFSIEASLVSANLLTASIKGETADIDKVNWYLNDNFVSNQINLSTLPAEGSNIIRAEVRLKNGALRKHSLMIHSSNPEKDIHDFGFYENNAKINNDYKLRIKASSSIFGELSSDIIDNQNATFQLNSAEYLGPNEAGIPVYRIEGKIKANVSSQSVPIPTPVELNISWAIPFK